MNVLITGATGFIGSRLALKCAEKNYSVRALGQENNPAESQNKELIIKKGAEVISGSVTNRDLMFEICNGIDWVFHLAAAQHEANVPDQHFRDINVSGTKNLLDGSVKARVKRFIHGSTIGVYGASLNGYIDERSVLEPSNIYGVTKLDAERLVLSYGNRLPYVVIRISETYGPGDRRLLKLFKAIKRKVFFMIGKGENLHHLIYIDDLIAGFFLAAESDAALGEVFVFAGPKPLTSNEMCGEIADYFNTTIPKLHAPLWMFLAGASIMESILRPLGIQPPLHRRRMDFFRKSFYLNTDHAYRKLGFRSSIGFRDGVRETAIWYEKMELQ